MAERLHIANDARADDGPDVFDLVAPPYDLVADMLFVGATAPTTALSRTFASIPFLRIGASTPLLVWFARVRSLEHGPEGTRRRLDATTGFGYDEVTVAALLRRRRVFVPGIYVGDALSEQVGHRYGMPKRLAALSFAADGREIDSALTLGTAKSQVRARLLASGRILAKPFDLAAPWWSWPAAFPDGSFIRARIDRVPRAQLAHVTGSLALREPWLSEPVALWPVGIYAPRLAMRLPAPEDRRGATGARVRDRGRR
jgi:hypothetical protein